jgi:hypothetical protein
VADNQNKQYVVSQNRPSPGLPVLVTERAIVNPNAIEYSTTHCLTVERYLLKHFITFLQLLTASWVEVGITDTLQTQQ